MMVVDLKAVVDKAVGSCNSVDRVIVKKCTGKGPIGKCPILEELYQ